MANTIKATINAFDGGLHKRLGDSSPVGLLDAYLAKEIILISILSEMLDDYHGTPEIEPPSRLEAMLQTYQAPLQQFNRERLEAYLGGTQQEFRSRVTGSHRCYECSAEWYDVSYPGDRRTCPKCGQSGRIGSWNSWASSIPPWVNIDTYATYSAGVPKRIPSPQMRARLWDDIDDDEGDYRSDEEEDDV